MIRYVKTYVAVASVLPCWRARRGRRLDQGRKVWALRMCTHVTMPTTAAEALSAASARKRYRACWHYVEGGVSEGCL